MVFIEQPRTRLKSSQAPKVLTRWPRQMTLASGKSAIHSCKEALAGERAGIRSRDEAIEAKTPSRIGDDKEALDKDQEDIEPGPFLGLTVEAEPEVRHEQHPDHAH